MRAVYWAVVLLAAALLSLFAVSNREMVSLGLWPLPFLAEAPLYIVVVVAVFVGFAVGAFSTWIKGRHRRRQLRECRRHSAALARELSATQSRFAGATAATQQSLPQTR